MSDIHSCSYYCSRPACVLAQRDELRDAIEALRAELAAARATNLKLRQYAKHYPECPMWGATGDEMCNCGLSGVMMETDKSRDPGISDPNSVICPNCCCQFQAVPVNVQEELARLRGELEQARLLFNKEFNENNESRRRLKADLAAARALLRDCLPELDGEGTTIHRVWAALAGKDEK